MFNKGVFLKRSIKNIAQRSLPSSIPPIIVASMGRSGSTLVWDAVRRSVAAQRFDWLGDLGIRLVSETAWDVELRKFVPGVVYKTHALAQELPRDSGAKVIFMFGSATDAALSVLACHASHGDNWIDEHFAHLRAKGPFEDLPNHDVLRFKEQLEGWIGKAGSKRLILHYDSLWEHQAALSEFVGVKVALPPRRPRAGASIANLDTRARFAETYAALDARIAALPRCQVLE